MWSLEDVVLGFAFGRHFGRERRIGWPCLPIQKNDVPFDDRREAAAEEATCFDRSSRLVVNDNVSASRKRDRRYEWPGTFELQHPVLPRQVGCHTRHEEASVASPGAHGRTQSVELHGRRLRAPPRREDGRRPGQDSLPRLLRTPARATRRARLVRVDDDARDAVGFLLDASTVLHRIPPSPEALSKSGQGSPQRVQEEASSRGTPW